MAIFRASNIVDFTLMYEFVSLQSFKVSRMSESENSKGDKIHPKLITCKGCNEQFGSILKHLNKNKLSKCKTKCITKYDESEIQEFRRRAKEISLEKRKAWKKDNKDHISAYNSVIYQENKDLIADRNRINKKSIAERDQKRYAKKKAEKAQMIHDNHVKSQTDSLNHFKTYLPNERRKQNRFEKKMFENRKSMIASLKSKITSDNTRKSLEAIVNEIDETFSHFETKIGEVELEVEGKGIEEYALVHEKYNQLKESINKKWHILKDKVDNILKDLTFQVGETFLCPRCIHTGRFQGEKCFFCERGFEKYNYKICKKHRHPPSVCKKKCNAKEEISEYEKIRERNISELKKKLVEIKQQCQLK